MNAQPRVHWIRYSIVPTDVYIHTYLACSLHIPTIHERGRDLHTLEQSIFTLFCACYMIVCFIVFVHTHTYLHKCLCLQWWKWTCSTCTRWRHSSRRLCTMVCIRGWPWLCRSACSWWASWWCSMLGWRQCTVGAVSAQWEQSVHSGSSQTTVGAVSL